MLTSILFAFFLFTLFLFGDSVLYRYFNQHRIQFSLVKRIAISLPIALAIHLFFSHALALITHSYRMSAIIIFALILISLLVVFLSKNYKIDFNYETSDFYIIGLALLVSISCAIRGHMTDSDNTHIAWVGSIIENNTYPPVLPINVDYPLTFYHYGIDLLISNISSITKAMPWDAISLQVAIGSFLVVLSLFSLINTFIESRLKSTLATLFVFFYTAFMAVEFFYKFADKISAVPFPDLIKAWQEAGLPSICHLSFYSVLVSQSVSLVSIFAIIMLLLASENQDKKSNIPIYASVLALSFLSYFTYPSFWYVSFCGLGLYALIHILKKSNVVNLVIFMVCLFLGKYLTLKSGATSFENINALKIAPSLYWDHFAMNFFKYFPADPSKIRAITDYVSGKRIFEVYLFSMTTFRNFGLIAIVAGLLAIWRIIKKDIDKSFIMLLVGLAGLPVPFLIHFILKPSETYRFPSWTKIVFLIFITISIIKIVSQNESLKAIFKNWFVRIVVLFHVALLTIPGLISILPVFSHSRLTNDELLNKGEQAGLKVLTKIHQAGDIALANNMFYSFSDITNIAGFYGVGGQMYQVDMETRATAISLMNPKLLEELDVDYVFLDENDKVSEIGVKRLNDPELFKEIVSVNKAYAKWRLFKFLNRKKYSEEEIRALDNEYVWVVGSTFARKFKIMHFEGNKIYYSAKKKDLSELIKNLKQLVKKQDVPTAIWLSSQAYPRKSLGSLLKEKGKNIKAG